MTWKYAANCLSVSRVVAGIAIGVIALATQPSRVTYRSLFVIYFVAQATDWFDGYLARKSPRPSSEYLDYICDAALILGGATALVRYKVWPLWAVIAVSVIYLVAQTGVNAFPAWLKHVTGITIPYASIIVIAATEYCFARGGGIFGVVIGPTLTAGIILGITKRKKLRAWMRS